MLEIENLRKTYGKTVALNDVSLTLTPGIYGLLGPNGAGKSTLMNIITLSVNPDSGEVRWDGKEINALKRQYREILGFMPQQQGLYDGFSCYEFLNYIAVLKGIPKAELKNEIARVAALTNMTEHLRKKTAGCSGGMKQRLLLASSILGDPKLIILDEPTAGLDPKERIRTRELVKSIAGGRIIIIATHIVSDIETVADEIILMKGGSVIAKEREETLCREYGCLENVYMHFFGEE